MSWKSLFTGGKKPEVAREEPPSPPFAFGKLADRRDFARLGGKSAPQFEHWLEEGLEGTRSRGGVFPEGPVAFSLPFMLTGSGLIGLMMPSRDAAGRVFPLAILRTRATGPAADLCTWWDSQAGFLADASAALGEVEQGGEAALLARLDEWAAASDPAPDEPVPSDALEAPALAALEAMFGPLGGKGPSHALATFCAACEGARKMRPDAPGITIEAPAPDAPTTSLWMTLAGRKLAWENARPAVLLSEDRLLLGLSPGTPASGLLTAYCVGAKAGPRHWTLTTEDSTVRARSSLPARAQAVLADPAATLRELVEALV